MSSSSCLLLLPCLPVPSIFPSITCLEGSSYKICDKYSYISFLLLYIGHSFPSWLCVILLPFSYERPNWSFPSFSRTTFQKFSGISDILSKESTFQHHKILCSKCRIYEFLPYIWVQFSGENSHLLFELCFCHGVPGFNFRRVCVCVCVCVCVAEVKNFM